MTDVRPYLRKGIREVLSDNVVSMSELDELMNQSISLAIKYRMEYEDVNDDDDAKIKHWKNLGESSSQ
jgi:hypothetical protein